MLEYWCNVCVIADNIADRLETSWESFEIALEMFRNFTEIEINLKDFVVFVFLSGLKIFQGGMMKK